MGSAIYYRRDLLDLLDVISMKRIESGWKIAFDPQKSASLLSNKTGVKNLQLVNLFNDLYAWDFKALNS